MIRMSIMLFILVAAFFLIGCKEDAPASNTGNTTDTESNAGKTTDTVKKQTTCPVMGGKINKDVYADHDGKGSISAARAVTPLSRKTLKST
jgi:PBP1b-binding outer membrane lipoprotein LpoB